MSRALASMRSRLPVARRNGVGMYTVTAIRRLLVDSSDAQVALAGVWKQRDHHLVRPEFTRDRARGEHRGPGRDAGEETFLAAQPSRPRGGVLVADLDDAVDDVAIQDSGHERRANPLDRMRPCL